MAITLTIVKKEKSGKIETYTRKLKIFHSMDKAKKEIVPIVKEMRLAKKMDREPTIRIEAVSYDTKSEKTLLLETGALVSIDNERDD